MTRLPSAPQTSFNAADADRRLANLIRIGVVSDVDAASATARVLIGSYQTSWLPMAAGRAGPDRSWAAFEVGEQVIVLSPSGEMSQGVIIAALYCNSHPAPETSVDVSGFYADDGAVLRYDRADHQLTITLPSAGKIVIDAPGGVTITGDVTIDGDLDVSGTATAATDVIGGGKSLKGHKHGQVQAGGAQSGVPL